MSKSSLTHNIISYPKTVTTVILLGYLTMLCSRYHQISKFQTTNFFGKAYKKHCAQTYEFDLTHPDVLPVIAENKINSTLNTSIFINGSRLNVSTLIGSSSGLLFAKSL